MAVQTFNPDNVMLSEKLDGTFTPEMTGTVMKDVAENSLVMQLGSYVEMNGKQEAEFNFQTDGVSAYWVDEGEKIQTSKPSFATATMRAKKLGVIVLASREYLHYTWSQYFDAMRSNISSAFYEKFDQAALLGVDNPFAFSVEDSVTTADNVIEGDITYDNVLLLEDLVYDAGHEVEAFISNNRNHSALRKAVDGNGIEIYDRNSRDIDGLTTVRTDLVDKGTLITGDFTDNLRYGVPYNIDFQISTEGQISTITNTDGSPVNLFEQELIAMRATMDVAFMTVNDEAFAKLQPVGAGV